MGTIKKFAKSMGAYAVQSFMYRMSGMLTQGLVAAIQQIQSLDASIVNLQIATGKTRQEIIIQYFTCFTAKIVNNMRIVMN